MTADQQLNLKNILKTLGPGLLFAGAAIGGSHLVQSTRAGATYGFSLVLIILIANFLKYPFFEYGHRYAATTGKSLLEGYLELGKPALYAFFGLNLITGVINTAAVTMVTASLAGKVLGFGLGVSTWSLILFIFTMALLFFGGYKWLDKSVKAIILLLAISTIAALVSAVFKGPQAAPDFSSPSIWNLAGFAFLVALLGWMPAPIEGSVWSSLWLLERKKETGHDPSHKEAVIDFSVGYVGTALLAVAFVSLGALVMYGTGEKFEASGIAFAGQVIQLYVKSLGGWSLWIISIAAFTTMISTTLTVVDAYPRTVTESVKLIYEPAKDWGKRLYILLTIAMCVTAFIVISFLAKNMRAMIDFATIASFLAAPIFAFINYRVVTDNHMPEAARPGKIMRVTSWVGMFFLSSISIAFIVWRFFI